MPRYNYRCSQCLKAITVIHSINKVLVDCNHCEGVQCMERLLSVPVVIKKTSPDQQQATGAPTKEYIEANREILEEEKSNRKTYEPS